MDNFFVNKTQLAQILKVTPQTLTVWQKQVDDPLPIHVKGKNGQSNQYDLAEAVAWLVRHEVNKLVVNADGEFIDYNAERARLTKEQADGQALKNEKIRANLISVNAAITLFLEITSVATTKLDSARADVKNRMPELTNAQYNTITRIYDDARNAIADVSPEAIVDKVINSIIGNLEST